MLWSEAGRSMHETVWKSPLIQDFPAWANWWNSSWNTGNHFTHQTFLKTEPRAACPSTQRCCINASHTDAIVCFKATVKGYVTVSCWNLTSAAAVSLNTHSVSPYRNVYSIQWIMSTRHEGHTNLYTLRSNEQNYKATDSSTLTYCKADNKDASLRGKRHSVMFRQI